MDDIEDIKRRNAERAAAQRGETARRSQLPADPSLPPDAQFLRNADGITPAEFFHEVMNDEDNDIGMRMQAAAKLAPIVHRPPVVKQEITVSSEEHAARLADGFFKLYQSGRLSLADARAMHAELSAQLDMTKH